MNSSVVGKAAGLIRDSQEGIAMLIVCLFGTCSTLSIVGDPTSLPSKTDSQMPVA